MLSSSFDMLSLIVTSACSSVASGGALTLAEVVTGFVGTIKKDLQRIFQLLMQ